MNRLWITGLAVVASLAAVPAKAVPVTVNYAGWFLDNVGTNTLGIAGGGTDGGTPTTLFVASTTPSVSAGTMGAAFQNGALIGGLFPSGAAEVARRTSNPVPSQLTPLTVAFVNGADSTVFVGRDLSGLSQMPLVTGVSLDVSADPFRPTVSWSLPGGAGDVDHVQIVFFNNTTNNEVGSRVTLAPDATSFTFGSSIAPSFDLTINVRLIDTFDDSLPLTTGNVQRMSRAYINYLAPVPEPGAWALMAAGLGALAWRRRRSR